MASCVTCDHYSARDRWCAALEDRVIHPDSGRCGAHSRPDQKPGVCVSCAGKGHRMLADYRGGPLQKVECWWCEGSGQSADACGTCEADDEEQCDACAFGAGEEGV